MRNEDEIREKARKIQNESEGKYMEWADEIHELLTLASKDPELPHACETCKHWEDAVTRSDGRFGTCFQVSFLEGDTFDCEFRPPHDFWCNFWEER